MIIRTFAAAAMAAGLMVSAANAVTVTNMESTRANIVYSPNGGKVHHYSLAANHYRNFACKDGGTFTIGKLNETCTAKTEKILLKASKGKWEFIVHQPKET